MWEAMASSVTAVGNPQLTGKKGKDKNKDMMVLMDDGLMGFNSTMSTLTDKVEDMDKQIEELESVRDIEELCG